MNRMVRDTRQPLAEIVAGGGGARSDLVMQINSGCPWPADLAGATVDTCSLGTAILAAWVQVFMIHLTGQWKK